MSSVLTVEQRGKQVLTPIIDLNIKCIGFPRTADI